MKVISGLRQACRGRDVDEDQLALLAQQVEEQLRSSGVSNVSSEEVGKAILPFLRDLDEVAYLRFASVYRNFDSVEDFARAIDQLRGRKPVTPQKRTTGKRRTKRSQVEEPTLLDT